MYVEVDEAEDVEFFHDGFGVRVRSGGRFLMSLMSFFCVLMSGCMYV